jgi:hypothetical protein
VLRTEKQKKLTDRKQRVANQLEKVVCGSTPCCADCRNYIPLPQQHKVEVCKVGEGSDGNEGLRATQDIQEGEIITMFGECAKFEANSEAGSQYDKLRHELGLQHSLMGKVGFNGEWWVVPKQDAQKARKHCRKDPGKYQTCDSTPITHMP